MADAQPTPNEEVVTAPLEQRLFVAMTHGACTCGLKNPRTKGHDPLCHFRLFIECRGEIARLNDAASRLTAQLVRAGGFMTDPRAKS